MQEKNVIPTYMLNTWIKYECNRRLKRVSTLKLFERCFKFLQNSLRKLANNDNNMSDQSIGCSFKFLFKVGVEKPIVIAPRITDQLFKSNLTFCVVFVFTLQTDEWCVHNRLFNTNLDGKFK
jgi:hypothetical protein